MKTCARCLASTALVFMFLPAANRLTAQTTDLSKIRSIAEAQHEIVMIFIKKKEFGKAAEEANKIFQMKWPDSEEPTLLRELLIFSSEFLRNGQPAMAVRLLETNLTFFKAPKSQATIWKEKGYMLEKMGEHDKALVCFRKAQELEVKMSDAPLKKVSGASVKKVAPRAA